MAHMLFRVLLFSILLTVLSFGYFSADFETIFKNFSTNTEDSADQTDEDKVSVLSDLQAPLQVPPSRPENIPSGTPEQVLIPGEKPHSTEDSENSAPLLPQPQKSSGTSAEQSSLSLIPDATLSPTEQEKADLAKNATEGDANAEAEDIIKGTINKGDTVGKLLGEVADNNVVQGYIDATRRVFPLTSFRAGQPYVLICDVQSGTVKRFEYEIDNKRRLIVEGEQPVARVEAIEYDVRLSRVEARIDSNLFQSVADIGESPMLAITLANLFGWEINFIRDLQEGDSFSVLVEKNYREGSFRGYGRVLGATFTNKGKTYEAFLFHNGQASNQHFNAKGENLKKVLLQAPLSFTRLTSRFTHSRKHPIFGNNRPHLGVDYGAPTGTPVKAVGDGTVTVRGWVGGYGNQVALRHAAGLESMYSHLSGFARGLTKGTKVRQGQVIAYVGSTGQSTGPHLDFRLKQGGKFIDPTKAVNPRSAAIYKQYAAAFAERMKFVREYLDGKKSLDDYLPTMVSSPSVSAKNTDEAKNDSDSQKSRKQPRKKRDS